MADKLYREEEHPIRHVSDHSAHEKGSSTYINWIYVAVMAFSFIFYGLLLFFVIGDKGSPVWDYAVVEDVPGESVYSTNTGPSPSGLIPSPRQYERVIRQHVMERPPVEQLQEERAKR
jgi:hypothetical protein